MAYWYLGSPYNKFSGGRAMACVEVCKNAALLIKAGVPVFSPIAHSHAIAEFGNIDPNDYDIWLPADKPMMDAAGGLIVLMLEGYRYSHGLGEERKFFVRAGKPVVHMVPGVVPVELLREGR